MFALWYAHNVNHSTTTTDGERRIQGMEMISILTVAEKKKPAPEIPAKRSFKRDTKVNAKQR